MPEPAEADAAVKELAAILATDAALDASIRLLRDAVTSSWSRVRDVFYMDLDSYVRPEDVKKAASGAKTMMQNTYDVVLNEAHGPRRAHGGPRAGPRRAPARRRPSMSRPSSLPPLPLKAAPPSNWQLL